MAGHRDTAYEVRRHDVGSEPPPAGLFDLVHARLVLVHVARREQALAAMVAAVRPGGWLLLEEADPALQPLVCPDEFGAEQELANKIKHGFRDCSQSAASTSPTAGRYHGSCGRQACGRAVRRILPDGRPACTELERATVEQVRDALIAAGIATEAELERHLLNVGTGRLDLATSPMVSAWGRKAMTK